MRLTMVTLTMTLVLMYTPLAVAPTPSRSRSRSHSPRPQMETLFGARCTHDMLQTHHKRFDWRLQPSRPRSPSPHRQRVRRGTDSEGGHSAHSSISEPTSERPTSCSTSLIQRAFGERLSELQRLQRDHDHEFHSLPWRQVAPGSSLQGYIITYTMSTGVKRTEFVEVTITPADIRAREGHFSQTVRKNLMDALGGRVDDEAGHIIANTFGGPNNAENFFPQSAFSNRNVGGRSIVDQWWDLENKIRDFLKGHSDKNRRVLYCVVLEYKDDTDGRPNNIFWHMQPFEDDQELTASVGSSLNRRASRDMMALPKKT